MDEARIQAMVDEIVDRVAAQVGQVPESPMEAVRNPPPGYAAATTSAERAPASDRARRRDGPAAREGRVGARQLEEGDLAVPQRERRAVVLGVLGERREAKSVESIEHFGRAELVERVDGRDVE